MGELVALMVNWNGVPIAPVLVSGVTTGTGGRLMRIEIVPGAVELPPELPAEIPSVKLPAAVGMPLMIPVLFPRLTPPGRLPLARVNARGELVAAT